MRDNLRVLEKFEIAGLPISAAPTTSPLHTPTRTRGNKGRAEAIDRGVAIGTGPGGKFPNKTRNVVVGGLPGKMTIGQFEARLKDFEISRSRGEATILKIPLYVTLVIEQFIFLIFPAIHKDQRTNLACMPVLWSRCRRSQKPTVWCGISI